MSRAVLAVGSIVSFLVCGLPFETVATQPPALLQDESAAQSDEAKVRRFTFQYRFRLKGLRPNVKATSNLVRVWMPCPPNNEYQEVARLPATTPAEIREYKETKFGNQILYLETQLPKSGELIVDVPYEVTRREVLRGKLHSEQWPNERLSERKRANYLNADRLVPTTGKPLELLNTVKLEEDKQALARQLYDIVDAHVAYKKEGTG